VTFTGQSSLNSNHLTKFDCRAAAVRTGVGSVANPERRSSRQHPRTGPSSTPTPERHRVGLGPFLLP